VSRPPSSPESFSIDPISLTFDGWEGLVFALNQLGVGASQASLDDATETPQKSSHFLISLIEIDLQGR
jgi:hypothetical protein